MSNRITYKEKSYAFIVTVPSLKSDEPPMVYKHRDMTEARQFWGALYFQNLFLHGASNPRTKIARKISLSITKRQFNHIKIAL